MSVYRLAVDPGRDSGLAILTDGALSWCGLADGTHIDAAHGWHSWLTGPGECRIERPQVYPGGRGADDPNDLITLALRAGEAAGYLRAKRWAIRWLLPREWKQQIPKDIHARRIVAALSDSERRILNVCLADIAPTKRHNVIDAVGLAKARV